MWSIKKKEALNKRDKVWIATLVIVIVVVAVVIPIVVLDVGGSSSLSGSSANSSTGGSNVDEEEAPPTSTPVPEATPAPSPTTPAPSTTVTPPPTVAPTTGSPTLFPSSFPSVSPSSQAPSESPTGFIVEPNPVPDDPPPGYFNYDIDDEEYGPNAWRRVDTSDHPMKEFGPDGWGAWMDNLEANPTENRCDDDGSRQSPKDLFKNTGLVRPGDGNDGRVCDAEHEIRSRCGSIPLAHPSNEVLIKPHKLSINLARRACLEVDLQECKDGRPPIADYPKYTSTGSDWSDLLNFDIKVPGEHTINGTTFEAEIQMLHAHLTNRKISSLGIPIRATEDGHHEDFQKVLDEFHKAHYLDSLGCASNTRNLRQQQQDISEFYKGLMEESIRGGFYNERSAQLMTDPQEFMRKLQFSPEVKFDPYNDFMADMTFFRYWGSMTEPPCLMATWWVMDKPMVISFEQVRQIKFLLFTHVDRSNNCQKTSVHNADQSVARPIQPLGPTDTAWIQHCVTGDFEPDIIQEGQPGRRCF